MNEYEAIACCAPVVEPILKNALALAELIHCKEGESAIRMSRDKLISSLDPSFNSSPDRLLMTKYLPLGEVIGKPLESLWKHALLLATEDYCHSAKSAKGICDDSSDLDYCWNEYQSHISRWETPSVLRSSSDADRLARRCLCRHGVPMAIDLSEAKIRELVFLELQHEGKTRSEIMEVWNSSFPDYEITSKAAVGARVKDAKNFINEARKEKKISP